MCRINLRKVRMACKKHTYLHAAGGTGNTTPPCSSPPRPMNALTVNDQLIHRSEVGRAVWTTLGTTPAELLPLLPLLPPAVRRRLDGIGRICTPSCIRASRLLRRAFLSNSLASIGSSGSCSLCHHVSLCFAACQGCLLALVIVRISML